MEKFKVLVVDDDVMHRKNITELLKSTGMTCAVHASANGELAMEWLTHNEVNVVLLDAVIGGKSSLEFLKAVKDRYDSVEVIMINDGTPRGVQTTLEGLQYGALDFIQLIPDADSGPIMEKTRNQLIVLFTQIKIRQSNLLNRLSDYQGSALARVQQEEPKNEAARRVNIPTAKWTQADLVLIAASTGGPAALEAICAKLPADFAQPILIVQHIPAEFTRALAESLGKKSKLPIVEGRDGDIIGQRKIILAPGGVHMVVAETKQAEKIIRLENTPHVNGVRPAADVLFKSCARTCAGKNILAVILTGMGVDGMDGVREIKKQCNCYCLVQSEKTCVVYGMPRCVHDAGLADEVVDLNDMAGRICKIAGAGAGW